MLLKRLAEELQVPYREAVATAGPDDAWRIREGAPLPPATEERPLTVVPGAQLASYGPGGQYVIHSDNPRDENGGRRNYRCFTAICYAQHDGWEEEDKGHLRLWHGTGEICTSELGFEHLTAEEVLRDRLAKERRDDAATPLEDGNAAYCTEVLPKGGRIVIFRSTELHQVTASTSKRRRAITMWIYAPQEGFVPS